MSFDIFNDLQNKFDNLNFEKKIIEKSVIDKADRIISINRGQLYWDGVNSNNIKMFTYAANTPNVYADSTIGIKMYKRQPIDRVTLKDTGAFYSSFKLEITDKFYNVYSSYKKELKLISENVDIRSIFGLTNTNKKVIIKELIPLINEKTKKFIKSLKI